LLGSLLALRGLLGKPASPALSNLTLEEARRCGAALNGALRHVSATCKAALAGGGEGAGAVLADPRAVAELLLGSAMLAGMGGEAAALGGGAGAGDAPPPPSPLGGSSRTLSPSASRRALPPPPTSGAEDLLALSDALVACGGDAFYSELRCRPRTQARKNAAASTP
jgi:hypothetical protein